MSHHNVFGDDPSEELERRLMTAYGPTGQFPHGKMTKQDEGEIAFGIAAYKHAVLIDFGKPIRSLGFEPKHAREFAQVLMAKAEEAEKQLSVREAVAGALRQ